MAIIPTTPHAANRRFGLTAIAVVRARCVRRWATPPSSLPGPSRRPADRGENARDDPASKGGWTYVRLPGSTGVRATARRFRLRARPRRPTPRSPRPPQAASSPRRREQQQPLHPDLDRWVEGAPPEAPASVSPAGFGQGEGPCSRGLLLERLMGFEPTTFRMARGTAKSPKGRRIPVLKRKTGIPTRRTSRRNDDPFAGVFADLGTNSRFVPNGR